MPVMIECRRDPNAKLHPDGYLFVMRKRSSTRISDNKNTAKWRRRATWEDRYTRKNRMRAIGKTRD